MDETMEHHAVMLYNLSMDGEIYLYVQTFPSFVFHTLDSYNNYCNNSIMILLY